MLWHHVISYSPTALAAGCQQAVVSVKGAAHAALVLYHAPWERQGKETQGQIPGCLDVLSLQSGCQQVAWVRRRGVGRALPRAHLQADLDIATLPGSSPSETLLADAEVIRAVSEVHRPPASISA